VTAWNVRGYGIYVEDGEQGVLDRNSGSGAADAAYYVGECRPGNRRRSVQTIDFRSNPLFWNPHGANGQARP
jgi:hypothetical protein